jgi:peptidylprolyl isomerase
MHDTFPACLSIHRISPHCVCAADRALPGSEPPEKEKKLKTVQTNDVVQVHYTGTLANGEVFDSSQGRDPLEVTIGQGQLISGFENALMGMSLNEKKIFTLPPEEAYGHRNEEALHRFSRAQIPPDMEIELGQFVALGAEDGQEIPARVVQLDAEQVVLDLNHPLAGESLTFDIEVVGIEG